MILGQTIQGAGTGNTLVFFTPWFPRQADNARFTFERVHSSLSGGTESVKVYSKEVEESGTPGTAAATFLQIGSTRFFVAEPDDLKELVRFRIELDELTGSLHFRFLQPTWFATAKESTPP